MSPSDLLPEPRPQEVAGPPGRLARLFGTVRAAYLPILVTYFAYGASGITAIALLYFEKDTLGLTPAEVASIGFWVGLPWSMKMVVGVASDRYPILGHRRMPYLILGALCSLVGYGLLATVVQSKGAFLAAVVLATVGFMIQDVIADALSVEVARDDREVAQIQTLGRMALLAGTISVGYLSGVLAKAFGPRLVFGAAMLLPVLVVVVALVLRREPRELAPAALEAGPL